MRTPTPSEVIRPVSIAGSCTGMARRCHDGQVDHAGGISLAQMLAVLDAVRAVGCRFWIEGGWGIDALVGHQTRPHRDVDIEIDGAFEEEVLAALRDLGYVIETDWRPNRVELTAQGRGWVDVHPLVIDDDGNARQAALGGGWHEFPRSFLTMTSRRCGGALLLQRSATVAENSIRRARSRYTER